MITSRFWLSGAAAALVLAAVLAAQDSATFKMDVNVVNLFATVRDRDGRIVSNLEKDAFLLSENGKEQEIRYFSRQADLPLTVGLLVDTSGSQRNVIDEERRGSKQFLTQVLRPEIDQAFLIKFDFEVELLQDLTNSRPQLEKALGALAVPSAFPNRQQPRRWSQKNTGGDSAATMVSQWLQIPGIPRIPGLPGGRGGGRDRGGQRGPGGQRPGGGPPGGRIAGVGTALYDAIYLASIEVLREQAGRKAIILLSDGVDMGSKVSRDEAIEAAQRADAIVYAIRYYDKDAYGRAGGRSPGGRAGGSGERELERISEETGGRLFDVSAEKSLDKVFAQIQEELRNQYSIGYTPSGTEADGFRTIQLSTKDTSFQVQTRAGYYPKVSGESSSQSPSVR